MSKYIGIENRYGTRICKQNQNPLIPTYKTNINSSNIIKSTLQKKVDMISNPGQAFNSDNGQPSTQEINIKTLENELERVRDFYECERKQKWQIMQAKQAIQNTVYIANTERNNALQENEKVREQMKQILKEIQDKNRHNMELIAENCNLRNRNSLLQKENNSLQDSMKKLQDHNKQTLEQGVQRQEYALKLNKLNSELNGQIIKLATLNKNYQSELESLKNDWKNQVELAATAQSFEPCRNKQLEDQINVLKEELQQRCNQSREMEAFFINEKERMSQQIKSLGEIISQLNLQVENRSKPTIIQENVMENIEENSKEKNHDKRIICEQEIQITSLNRLVLELRAQASDLQTQNHYCNLKLEQYESNKKISIQSHQSNSRTIMTIGGMQCLTPRQYNLKSQLEAKKLYIIELEEKHRNLEKEFWKLSAECRCRDGQLYANN